MCGGEPKRWAYWLHLAEFWYNTNYHTSLLMTPFEALYGYKPHMLTLEPFIQSKVQGISDLMQDKQTAIQKLKQVPNQARERMILSANKNRVEREFQVGDWVYFKLRPYKQLTIHKSHVWKLSPKYVGPFQILFVEWARSPILWPYPLLRKSTQPFTFLYSSVIWEISRGFKLIYLSLTRMAS